jgi:hypothetical protein
MISVQLGQGLALSVSKSGDMKKIVFRPRPWKYSCNGGFHLRSDKGPRLKARLFRTVSWA